MLQMSLNKMKEAAASQTKVIEDLTNTLDQLRYTTEFWTNQFVCSKIILILLILRSSPGVKQQAAADTPTVTNITKDDIMRKRHKRDDNDDVEIIRPAKQEWCDNGVFVFRKGKEVNICIKLPIRVEMEGRWVNL